MNKRREGTKRTGRRKKVKRINKEGKYGENEGRKERTGKRWRKR